MWADVQALLLLLDWDNILVVLPVASPALFSKSAMRVFILLPVSAKTVVWGFDDVDDNVR